MTRTSKRLAARSAARQRQAKANEDQRHREHTELDHTTEFEVARLRRDDAAATVVAHEIAMARQVQTLLALGNSVARVAELTGDTQAEINRLRRLARTNDEDPGGSTNASSAARDDRRRGPGPRSRRQPAGTVSGTAGPTHLGVDQPTGPMTDVPAVSSPAPRHSSQPAPSPGSSPAGYQ